jgi:hypothetical protein
LSDWREQRAKAIVESVGGHVSCASGAGVLSDLSRQWFGAELFRRTCVNLDGCRVTDYELSSLDGFQRLTMLSLAQTPVTDANLIYLSKLQDVAFLDLSRTEVSDVGLLRLQGLRHLDTLLLYDTHATSQGVTRFRSPYGPIKIKMFQGQPRIQVREMTPEPKCR